MSTQHDDLRHRPVIALDIDGVVRVPYARLLADGREGYVSREVTLFRDDYPLTFHGEPTWGEDGTSTGTEWFSQHAFDWLRGIVASDAADIVLATTWQDQANRYFLEPEGLGPFRSVVNGGSRGHQHSAHWKVEQIAESLPGRPVVWVDDNLPYRPEWQLDERRAPRDRAATLSIAPDPFTGLTPEGTAIIDEWIALASTPDGHEILRASRRRNKQRASAQERRLKEAGW